MLLHNTLRQRFRLRKLPPRVHWRRRSVRRGNNHLSSGSHNARASTSATPIIRHDSHIPGRPGLQEMWTSQRLRPNLVSILWPNSQLIDRLRLIYFFDQQAMDQRLDFLQKIHSHFRFFNDHVLSKRPGYAKHACYSGLSQPQRKSSSLLLRTAVLVLFRICSLQNRHRSRDNSCRDDSQSLGRRWTKRRLNRHRHR
jgi:hypothetical protein